MSGPDAGAREALLRRPDGVARVRRALSEADLDGWLLYEFHGHNPVAAALLGLEWTTRRSFTLVRPDDDPVALIHAIEASYWREWPWERRTYAGWREMEEGLAKLLDGPSRIAMEVSPRSAVPTLDLVPAGIVELVREAGAEPVSSGDLVSAFHATWTPAQLEGHRRSAETAASVARRAFRRVAEAVKAGEPTTEGALSRWILEELEKGGLGVEADCIVAVGARAADPHYVPGETGETIDRGRLLLIDLWGRPSRSDVFADQTWMAYLGSELPDEARAVWSAVREARDAAVALLGERFEAGEAVRGRDVDDVARDVIRDHGYGECFVHRTGHSIDTELHGSGPNLDNLETRDERRLIQGVGFSVEPGIYIPDRIGVRSEVNVHWGADGPEVTPSDPQDEVFLLLDE